MKKNIIPESIPVIETQRIILKEISEVSSVDMLEIFSDEEVLKYYDLDPLNTIEEVKELITILKERFNAKRAIRWGIYLKENGKLIGTCGYHSLEDESLRAEIGYELAKNYWGQGFMKEALGAIIKLGFHEMSLNRIQALVEPKNSSSVGLLEKIGFSREGILREYEYLRGSFKDVVMLSMLRSDFVCKR